MSNDPSGSKPKRSILRRLLTILVVSIAVIALALFALVTLYSETKPTGKAGPEADALARRMVDWTNPAGWANTGAVRWDFAGRFKHLWDRQRGYSKVVWGPYEVIFDLATQKGVARSDGVVVEPKRAAQLIETAYGRWINDSFWLNPFSSFFDTNVRREIVDLEDGGRGLLITYGAGGLTPGDSYLWTADESGRPRAWKMWVSIIPIGGLEVSWDDWLTLPTGAKISTVHHGPIDLLMKDVAGAPTLEALLEGAPDPFAALSVGTSSTAASRPATR